MHNEQGNICEIGAGWGGGGLSYCGQGENFKYVNQKNICGMSQTSLRRA